jgi:hypothetical protein
MKAFNILFCAVTLCTAPKVIAVDNANQTNITPVTIAKIQLIGHIFTCDSQAFKKNLDRHNSALMQMEIKLLQLELSQVAHQLKRQKEQAIAKCLDKTWQRGLAGLCTIPEAIASLIFLRATMCYLLLENLNKPMAIINLLANGALSIIFTRYTLEDV